MAKQVANGTNTNIGLKETFLDRNAKLIPSDEDTMALTNAKWIAGHHTVETLNDLYNIKPFILNPKYYAQSDEDTNHVQTIGQLWYVVTENAFYQLIDWDKRDTKDGWSKTNIKAIKGPDGKNNEQHIGPADFITKVSINGDGTLTGTTGSFSNSTTPGTFNQIATKNVIPSNTQIITNVNIDNTGKLSYTYGVRPVLSIGNNNASITYESNKNNQTFNVVDGISVNDHNISYRETSITVLSQSHHTGSFSGNFLTSATLSATGTLTGTTGNFTNSSSSGSYNQETIKTVIPSDAQIITNVNIDNTGKLSYTYGVRPILSVDKTNNTTHTYIQGQSKFQFDVIDGIEVNDHKITYHHSNIETLSQSHHSGSFNGDFLTSAILSATGTLSGSVGKFQNEQTNDIGKLTAFGESHTINYGKSQVITYVYIDNKGKLWTEASSLTQPINGINITGNNSNVTLSYEYVTGDETTNKGKHTVKHINLPIATTTTAGVVTSSTYTYFENAYTYHNKAYNWINEHALKKSPLPGNEIEYIWAGTQANYNALGDVSEYTTTLFIIKE